MVMRSHYHQFSRQELFDLLWATPKTQLAKDLGVSDVGLAKACRRAGIPLPGRGYWARRAAGKPVVAPSLPPRGLGKSDFVTIGHDRSWGDDIGERLRKETRAPPVFPEAIALVRERARSLIRKVTVPKSLANPHPAIRRYLEFVLFLFLSYQYDAGGALLSAEGSQAGAAYTYLKRLTYDKFGARVYVDAGNGDITRYTYNPLKRRLDTLNAVSGQGVALQALSYTYDNVGNILSLNDAVPVPPPNSLGGPIDQTFHYDDLYRLTGAQGTYTYSPSKTRTYTLAMSYDAIDNITSKSQADTLTEPSGTALPQKKTSYAWVYAYSSPHPHAPTHIGDRTFTYDADGNQTGWTNDQNGTRRTITWDEENRIAEIQDNGHTDRYVYDASGTRIIKRGPQGETVYVNPWFTIRNGSIVTKAVYAGAVRLATVLVPGDKISSFPGQGLIHRSPEGSLHGRNTQQNPNLQNRPYPGVFVYYYHPDHLGSTAEVTDQNARLYESLAYFPFGETWIDRGPNTQRIPYRYTAKELDQDTQLYYYGARYYDPRTSVWESADPAVGQYLPNAGASDPGRLAGAGGIYNPANIAMYSYAQANPIVLKDPDGLDNIAVIVGVTWSTPSNLGNWRGQYRIYRYNVYHLPNWVPVWAEPTASRLFGKKVGAFAITWAARSPRPGNRGTVRGDTSKMAQVSLGGGKHPIHVTDVGRSKQDVFTQVLNGKTIRRYGIRMHWGGPHGSTGCATTCNTTIGLSKTMTEHYLEKEMGLKTPGQNYYIVVPRIPKGPHDHPN